MLQVASSQLGCAVGNVTCYCTSPEFGYGVRDCSNQACQNSADAQSVISYGLTFCSGKGPQWELFATLH
ncbi:hypothetical protein BAUCODRAFT_34958 [Baudoinia panamericana UAMH 10762]|uniref:CFEM domain-containing protein n=1 Tax=Baudoinia panamericana (strain UAMH 10762) TaxID=717646 RepID=M2MTU5_BAUPA|nr:uncharacterized protein BAUCODRAFT_34958 [Baudoinia panamericana UAMH 10762]EMC94958.1 hypothetical protein BAUCODRAFT_34958 [Baudoinia panamericana UAMH 10762]